MTRKLVKSEKLALLAICLISLITTPFFSYDAIILPRFVLLVVFAFLLFFYVLSHKTNQIFSNHKPVLFIASGFIIWSFASLLSSEINFTDVFFGIPGRFNGILTYVSFIFFLGIFIVLSRSDFNYALLKLLGVTGIVSAIYGFIQHLGKDPFGWINEYSPVFSFFGNPNFLASYLGISATASIALAFKDNKSNFYRLIWIINIPFSLFIISKSKSQQGFLVFITGITVVIFLWLRSNSKLKKLTYFHLMTSLFGFIAITLDILQKSPWQSLLYKESVSYRGDFWRAGWAMTLDNPIFGVGLGGYGDYFRQYRDQVSANRVDISSNVDSAHNIFLDISSSGGFPLLILYIGLVLLTLISATRIIKRSKTFDFTFAGIFGAWLAYSAQSLISVSQIGLAIWGWALSGVIIGYDVTDHAKNYPTIAINAKTKIFSTSLGLIIGLVFTVPFLIADTQFRSTVGSGNVNKISSAVQKWPQGVEKMNFATALFRQGGFPDQSLVIARRAVDIYPRSYEAWEQLYMSPNAAEEEIKIAFTKMKNLDPLNQKLRD